jgi:hypothetical protein
MLLSTLVRMQSLAAHISIHDCQVFVLMLVVVAFAYCVYRERLTKFYEVVNPKKLADIEDTIKR